MPSYEVDIEYSLKEGTALNVVADDVEDAEFVAFQQFNELYSDAIDPKITATREIKTK